MGLWDDITGAVGTVLPGFGGSTVGGFLGAATGTDDARRRREEQYNQGLGAIGGYRDQAVAGLDQGLRGGLGALGSGYNQARGALGAGYGQGRRDALGAFGQAQGALGQGRSDMLGAYGQGQGALGAGLAGGLGAIGAGAGQAQGLLAGQIGQDAAARSAYADRLMGGLAGGDDPYWNRLSGQRTSNIEASLAKQGMLGSSAGANALADSGAQLQQAREQQFFDRAQGLFNAGAAGQAAGLAQQAGMAGADLYGQTGRAGAGLYGQQAEGLGGLGRASAGLYGDQGQFLGNMGARQGEGISGLFGREADQSAGLFGDYGRGVAGANLGAMGPTAGMYQGLAGAQGNGWLNDQASGALGTVAGIFGGRGG